MNQQRMPECKPLKLSSSLACYHPIHISSIISFTASSYRSRSQCVDLYIYTAPRSCGTTRSVVHDCDKACQLSQDTSLGLASAGSKHFATFLTSLRVSSMTTSQRPLSRQCLPSSCNALVALLHSYCIIEV